jgi:hypothetical protein
VEEPPSVAKGMMTVVMMMMMMMMSVEMTRMMRFVHVEADEARVVMVMMTVVINRISVHPQGYQQDLRPAATRATVGYASFLAVVETGSVKEKTMMMMMMMMMMMSVKMTRMVMMSWCGGQAGGVYCG